jgi:hypothetical protein
MTRERKHVGKARRSPTITITIPTIDSSSMVFYPAHHPQYEIIHSFLPYKLSEIDICKRSLLSAPTPRCNLERE